MTIEPDYRVASGMISKVTRFWATVRHLKAAQVFGRFRFLRPSINTIVTDCNIRQPSGRWHAPPKRQASMLAPSRFKFLGAVHDIDSSDGWNNPEYDKLWLYNLHYFEDLNSIGAADRILWHREWIERWIAENPVGEGNGWEPYPISLRIVNWIKWLNAGNHPTPNMLGSMVVQMRWLKSKLEWHLLGNHLFANAKALVYAGLFFEGDEAEKWLKKAFVIIDRELPEQVLSDGGNFERSIMYHALFLEDVLDLINATNFWPQTIAENRKEIFSEVAGRMLEFLHGMSHPDGEIALFNDGAFGIALSPKRLTNYLSGLGVPAKSPEHLQLKHWPDSGYVRLEKKPLIAFLDIAPIGPDYLPGHAHADTLSFEMSLWGQRVVVNGGTSCYGLSQTRQQERSTAAHSTVEVAGQNSSDTWAGFRVARRAKPIDLMIQDSDNIIVAGAHDGYKRLPGAPIHKRKWCLETNYLEVSDQVTDKRHKAIARYILHPNININKKVGNNFEIELAEGQHFTVSIDKGHAEIRDAWYSDHFGERKETRCLEVRLIDGECRTTWAWS